MNKVPTPPLPDFSEALQNEMEERKYRHHQECLTMAFLALANAQQCIEDAKRFLNAEAGGYQHLAMMALEADIKAIHRVKVDLREDLFIGGIYENN